MGGPFAWVSLSPQKHLVVKELHNVTTSQSKKRNHANERQFKWSIVAPLTRTGKWQKCPFARKATRRNWTS